MARRISRASVVVIDRLAICKEVILFFLDFDLFYRHTLDSSESLATVPRLCAHKFCLANYFNLFFSVNYLLKYSKVGGTSSSAPICND